MSKTCPIRPLLAMAGFTFALGVAAQTGAAVPAPDRAFAEKAAAGGAAEVEGGKIAEQRAANPRSSSSAPGWRRITPRPTTS